VVCSKIRIRNVCKILAGKSEGITSVGRQTYERAIEQYKDVF